MAAVTYSPMTLTFGHNIDNNEGRFMMNITMPNVASTVCEGMHQTA
jgi:hypothetical protein